jgi:hypothetical protein
VEKRAFQTVLVLCGWSMLTSGCAAQPPAASQPAPKDAMRTFETPFWRQPGDLLLRSGATPEEGLLFQHLTAEQVVLRQYGATSAPAVNAPCGATYRLRPEAARLEPAGTQDWRTDPDRTCDCATRREQPLPAPFVFDAVATVLRRDGQPVSTAGQSVLEVLPSPDGTRLAVLSAAGVARSSVAPGLGQRGPEGPYFVEVFQLDGFRRLGAALRFPGALTAETRPWQGCWSAAARELVYTDLTHQTLWLVHLDKLGE